MSTKSFKRLASRTGLTLIEVVAGLALMGTLLVSMLVLKSRFTHQLAESNQRLIAVAAADSLLQQWWSNPATFPINRSGSISQFPGLSWQTHLATNDVVTHLDSKVVRLDITSGAKVVTSVELVLPAEHHRA